MWNVEQIEKSVISLASNRLPGQDGSRGCNGTLVVALLHPETCLNDPKRQRDAIQRVFRR